MPDGPRPASPRSFCARAAKRQSKFERAGSANSSNALSLSLCWSPSRYCCCLTIILRRLLLSICCPRVCVSCSTIATFLRIRRFWRQKKQQSKSRSQVDSKRGNPTKMADEEQHNMELQCDESFESEEGVMASADTAASIDSARCLVSHASASHTRIQACLGLICTRYDGAAATAASRRRAIGRRVSFHAAPRARATGFLEELRLPQSAFLCGFFHIVRFGQAH